MDDCGGSWRKNQQEEKTSFSLNQVLFVDEFSVIPERVVQCKRDNSVTTQFCKVIKLNKDFSLTLKWWYKWGLQIKNQEF